MLRYIVVSLCFLCSAAYSSDPEVKSIQTALNKLGYNVGKADGINGKKTQASIARFIADESVDKYSVDLRNILESHVAELPNILRDAPIYNKSPYVSYGFDYQRIDDWFDYSTYQSTYNSYYEGMRLGFKYEIPLKDVCKTLLKDPLLFQNFTGSIEKDGKLPAPQVALDCIKTLQTNINQEVVEQGVNSPSLQFFFNEIVPVWTDPNTDLKSNPIDNVTSLRDWFHDKFLVLYLTYDDLVGTTEAQDRNILNFFERTKVQLRPSILDDTVANGCVKNAVNIAIDMHGNRTAKNFSAWNNSAACGDETAERAEMLAHMGSSFGIPDYIDEAIHRMTEILSTATSEGYTKQTLRYDEASGYMMQLAQRMERTAHIILLSTGRNIYDEDLAGNGVTVRKVIQAAVDAYLDPPSIKHVAELIGRSERYRLGITAIHPPSHWPPQHDNFWAGLRLIEARALQQMGTFFPKSSEEYSKWLDNKKAYWADPLDWAVVRQMHDSISVSLGKY